VHAAGVRPGGRHGGTVLHGDVMSQPFGEAGAVRLVELVAPSSEYPDFVVADTRVITYGIGPRNDHDQHWAPSGREARRQCREEFGRILEAQSVAGRMFFRVYRPGRGPKK